MPTITAAGDIISVNGKAGFKEGIVKGEVGGVARVSYEAKAEFCHGLTWPSTPRH